MGVGWEQRGAAGEEAAQTRWGQDTQGLVVVSWGAGQFGLHREGSWVTEKADLALELSRVSFMPRDAAFGGWGCHHRPGGPRGSG